MATRSRGSTSRVTRVIRQAAPEPLKRVYRRFIKHPYLAGRYGLSTPKHAEELLYWLNQWKAEGRTFKNHFYERRMLAMAGESSGSFVAGRVVADFGCGPRGSLCWATQARRRIGIDVLADAYQRRFDLSGQNMEYVCSSETSIPLPDDSVHVLFTMNALDHVQNLEVMCNELVRVLAPSGLFIGSFNLDQPATTCEPQTLTEEMLDRCLIRRLAVQSRRVVPRGPPADLYRYFCEDRPGVIGPKIMWLRAAKPVS